MDAPGGFTAEAPSLNSSSLGRLFRSLDTRLSKRAANTTGVGTEQTIDHLAAVGVIDDPGRGQVLAFCLFSVVPVLPRGVVAYAAGLD